MIFLDTWAWIALGDRHDQYHAAATALHRRLMRARSSYVTTDAVLGETITYLYGAIPASTAGLYIESILRATESGKYRLIHITPDRFRQAWQLRLKYSDKPGISFVDLTSMAVMQELGIAEVFTGDAHFAQVGLGFRLLP